MAYKITQRQKTNAQKLGVTIRTSSNSSKKLDVFRQGKKIAEIGASGYMDYDLYLKAEGKEYADKRRRLYKLRHESNRHKRGTPGFYADKILW